MKKQRRLKLEMNKVSISKLNNIKGGDDPVGSIVLCALTEGPDCTLTDEFTCTITMNVESCGFDECPSVTGITIINNSGARDC